MREDIVPSVGGASAPGSRPLRGWLVIVFAAAACFLGGRAVAGALSVPPPAIAPPPINRGIPVYAVPVDALPLSAGFVPVPAPALDAPSTPEPFTFDPAHPTSVSPARIDAVLYARFWAHPYAWQTAREQEPEGRSWR